LDRPNIPLAICAMPQQQLGLILLFLCLDASLGDANSVFSTSSHSMNEAEQLGEMNFNPAITEAFVSIIVGMSFAQVGMDKNDRRDGRRIAHYTKIDTILSFLFRLLIAHRYSSWASRSQSVLSCGY
jgi:hypothetical protein